MTTETLHSVGAVFNRENKVPAYSRLKTAPTLPAIEHLTQRN